jgi:hypothetical protein
MLVLLLLFLAFRPGVYMLPNLLTRSNPVRMGVVEATIPRFWRVRNAGNIVQAQDSCLTFLCTLPPAIVTVQQEPGLIGKAQAYRDNAESTLRKIGYGTVAVHEIKDSHEKVFCVEGSGLRGGGERSLCLFEDLGVSISFRGESSRLPTYYGIVQSVRSATP